MSDLNLGTAIGFQAFFVISVFILLSGWVVQFNRLTGKEHEVPPVETGSLIIAGVAVVFIGLESADPFGEWGLINGYVLRLLSITAMTCNALWLIFNGTFQASLLLVIVGSKLKNDRDLEKRNRSDQKDTSDEGAHWDNYTRAKYFLCFVWAFTWVMLIVLTILDGEDQGGFLMVFLVLVLLGVLASGGATFYGLYKAYDVKLGSREVASNDVKKNARRKIAVKIFEVLGYHLVYLIIVLVDIGLSAPTGKDVEGDLASTLIVLGIANRIFISFELWFNWYDFDERGYTQKIEDRRKKYKIISVERMIDQRIAIEQKKRNLNMETIMSEDVLRNTVVHFDVEESPDAMRTRGYTEDYVRNEALRTAKGSRKKAVDDDAVPDKKMRMKDGSFADISSDNLLPPKSA